MSHSWSVVKFLSDGCVEAVPSLWLDGDSSFWPPVAAKLITGLVKKCEPAAPSWPKQKIQLMTRVTFDTYLKAREKARLAEDTSDLQSDEPPGKRRRIIPKKFWSSEEDSDNEVRPLDKSTQNVVQPCSVDDSSLAEHLDDREETCEMEKRLHEIHGTDTSSLMTPIENVAVPSCSSCMEKDKQIQGFTTQMYLLRALVADTLQEVKNLRKEMMTGRAAEEPVTSIFTKDNLQFPLTTMEDLNKFDSILRG